MDINEEAARERMEEINRPEQLIFVSGNTRTVLTSIVLSRKP